MSLNQMIYPLILIVSLSAVVISGQSSDSDDRVKVTVYYETLCPDSQQFIRYQLWPTYQNVSSIMDIELVPYGKASYTQSNGSISFRCQHGPRECRGNMIQACAIKILQGNQSQTVPFVKCMESQRMPEMAGAKCARQLNMEYAEIQSCSDGPMGQQALLEMGRKTEALQPAMYFVPWININDRHTDQDQNAALANLLQLVCESYSGNVRPESCSPFESRKGHTPAPTTTSSTSVWCLLPSRSIDWFLSESLVI